MLCLVRRQARRLQQGTTYWQYMIFQKRLFSMTVSSDMKQTMFSPIDITHLLLWQISAALTSTPSAEVHELLLCRSFCPCFIGMYGVIKAASPCWACLSDGRAKS